MNYPWNWSAFWQPSPDGRGLFFETFFHGIAWTLAVALTAWIIALAIGLVVGVLKTLPNRPAQIVASAWVDLFRNVPLLVQMFLWYFVVPELLPADLGMAIKRMDPQWGAFLPATLALALFTSARVAEQVRAGIQSLPKGQARAGTALGLNVAQTYRYVLLPVALRTIIPPMTSEFMNTIKNSSVALTLGVFEITAAARAMQEFSFQVFEAFTAATLIYVTINLLVAGGMRILEARLALPGRLGGK